MNDEIKKEKVKRKKGKGTRQRGCIFSVGKKRYRIRVCIGKNEITGRYDYDDRTICGDWDDAERVRSGIVRDLYLGIYAPPSQCTLNEHLDDWLKAQRRQVAERTADGYAGYIDRYVRGTIGKKRLVNLKPGEIQSLYNEMHARGLSPTTIKHTHVVLKSALKNAFQLRLIPFNPADPVKVAKVEHKERRVFTPDEAIKFLEVTDNIPHGLVFETALVTGTRPEEFLALRWPDIDFERKNVVIQRVLVRHKGKVSFEKTKTMKSRRTIPIPNTLVLKLKKYKRKQTESRLKAGSEWQNNNLVFCSDIGTPLQIANLTYRYYRPILEKAGLPQIRLYDLRHCSY